MAFLFKSKKSQDRALSSRDGNSGSQGSIQSASSRIARDEKNAAQRATPTGSLNSVDEVGTGSPEQARRGGSLEQVQPSDLAVSHAKTLYLLYCIKGGNRVNGRFLLTASKSTADGKSQCLSIPLVAKAANIYSEYSNSFSPIWRRRQRNRFERR